MLLVQRYREERAYDRQAVQPERGKYCQYEREYEEKRVPQLRKKIVPLIHAVLDG